MEKTLDICDSIIRKVDRVFGIAAAVLIACMTLHIVIVVISTEVLHRGFFLPVDTTGYFYLIALALGYGGFQYQNGFIRITMLIDKLGEKGRRIDETLISILLTLFYSFLTYQCFVFAHNQYVSGQTLGSISIKIFWFGYILAFGFLWTAIVSLYQTVRLFVKGVESTNYLLPEEKVAVEMQKEVN